MMLIFKADFKAYKCGWLVVGLDCCQFVGRWRAFFVEVIINSTNLLKWTYTA